MANHIAKSVVRGKHETVVMGDADYPPMLWITLSKTSGGNAVGPGIPSVPEVLPKKWALS